MTIDADIEAIAKHWGLDPSLIQAVVVAEGNIVRAVQCSVPTVTTRAEALEVLCRSCTHALWEFVKSGSDRSDFIYEWAQRWAPQGAENDPKNLNANWPTNVLRLWV